MTIYRAKDFVDAYRARALSGDINDMSGRDGRPDITEHVSQKIADELLLESGDTLVDIGCGDGTLLQIALERGIPPGRVVGVLPTDEEVQRVRQRFSDQCKYIGSEIVVRGFSNETTLPSGMANKCVCNGVLLLLPGVEEVQASIAELVRITQSGGLILIGEVPELDEGALLSGTGAVPVTESVMRRAWLVLKQSGIREVLARVKNRCVATLGRRRIVIAPPTTYWSSPAEFEALATSLGLVLRKKYRSPQLSMTGTPEENPYRWNYIFERP